MSLSDIWTLYDGVTEKTLADWGVESALVTRRSHAADTCELLLGNVLFDSAQQWAYGTTLRVKRDGATWFSGEVTQVPRQGRPEQEAVRYVLSGPWWWLDNMVYQQNWMSYAGGADPVSVAQSRVVLGADLAGDLITTGDQIADAVNYAIGAGAALQMGVLDCALQFPCEEGVDLTCAEVVKRMLRWHPDVVTWLDYTATPPKLHLRQRANLAVLAGNCAGAPSAEVQVAARPELQRPVVAIKYEQTNTVNGVGQRLQTVDAYPDGQAEAQARALVLTVDLEGSNETFLTQIIGTQAPDGTSAAWWKQRLPALNDPIIKNLTYLDGSVALNPVYTGESVYANELIEGAIADWMNKHSSEVLVSANFSYDEQTVDDSGNAVVAHVAQRQLAVKIVTTDAATGTYRSQANFTPGDPVPSGLAQGIYTAMADLQYEGSYRLAEAEVGSAGGPWLGRVLNLAGGLAEWATMRAVIFSTEENLGTGETVVRFGPVTYVAPSDMVSHLRTNRARRAPTRAARATGLAVGGEQHLARRTPKENASAGIVRPRVWKVYPGGDPTSGNNITVDLTGSDLTDLPENLVVKLREVDVLVDGVVQKALRLSSQAYTHDA